jgi:LPS-assembly lipoprotein
MRNLLAFFLFATLAACGFQLRGAYTLPFATLHIGLPETAELRAQIRRTVEASSPTRVTNDVKAADASLLVLGDAQQRLVLTLNASGQAREYQLVRTFNFRLIDTAGRELIAPSRIVIHREITYSDELVLAKESEEALLWRDIQNDLVQQLMRRLAAAKGK